MYIQAYSQNYTYRGIFAHIGIEIGLKYCKEIAALQVRFFFQITIQIYLEQPR